ncbi:Uma2 family endonuclease [Actinomadura macra]|uniref:Uma2 family endonuclease n=1 Tax=Actinomadura macra TaxID=46164 RepID=UPI0008334209|nr:Uma2 family endonuclease [Actinomadura macra]
MSADSLPDWLFPPPGGFTADHFLRMNTPRHTELIDGSLVFVSPQEKWQKRVIDMLDHELDRQAPQELRGDSEMAVKLAKRQAPEPDVLVVSTEAFERDDPSRFYFPADVVLAVEAVSPESVDRDRDTKPRKYAAAGIRHFWRVENEDGETVVYVYELDPATNVYALTGIHRGTLKVTVPFDIEIDLTAVGRRAV